MQTSKSQPKRKPPTTIPTQRTQHDAELVDEMADFIDEVDAILEDNALEVTRRYRQKGWE